MSAMEDQERPPPYFGDYPHGAYWSAVTREGTNVSDEDEDYTVAGSHLGIMWDEEAGPLWASDGLLPDDPEWLRRALGLSDSLVADLLTWLSDMTALHRGLPVAARGDRMRRLDQRGRELAERLQTEVGNRYSVWYHA